MKKVIYALGVFDGVHLGHRALLNECCRLAEQGNMEPGAVTFRSHPDALLSGAAPVLINTISDRERLLRRFVPQVVTLPFDRRMLQTPWEAFLALLRADYAAGGFVCGDDFCFGSRGFGNGSTLADYCAREGLPCAVVPEQTVEGVRVSSTHIRALLERGEMAQAVRFLGHPHILSGTVVHGRQLGRTLGIPTANIACPEGVVVPRHGVYAVRVRLDGRRYTGVANIGTRPTVSGEGVNVETWLLDYSGDLYGREITLAFYTFLRPERKFSSLEEMRGEIRRNAQQAQDWFSAEKTEKILDRTEKFR